MKTNFTNTELGTIASTISNNSNLTLRINKSGNVDVAHKNADLVHFVFRKGENGYTIRRLFGTFKGSEQKGGKIGKRYFATLKDATRFFATYMTENESKLSA